MYTEETCLARLDEALKGAMEDGSITVKIEHVRRLVDQLGEALRDDNEGRAEAKAQWEIDVFKISARHDLEHSKLHRAEAHAWDIALFNAVIAYGQAALKAVFLVSGGAAAALLAFLAHLVTEHASGNYIQAAVQGIRWFGASLIFATFAQGLTYVSQVLYSRAEYGKDSDPWHASADVVRGGVALLALVSIALAAVAIDRTATPFERYGAAPSAAIGMPSETR